MKKNRSPIQDGGIYRRPPERNLTWEELRQWVEAHNDVPRLLCEMQESVCEYLKRYHADVPVEDPNTPDRLGYERRRSDRPPFFRVPTGANHRAHVASEIAQNCQDFLKYIKANTHEASMFREGIYMGLLWERFQVLAFDGLVRKHRKLGKGSGKGRKRAAQKRHATLYDLLVERRKAVRAGSRQSETELIRKMATDLDVSMRTIRRARDRFEGPRRKNSK